MPKTPPNWTRTGTVVGYADWLCEKSDAICVLVIRPHDSVFSVDPRCPPAEAERLVKEYVPRLAERVEQARREKKQAARLELGPLHE
jgi:hypothetical protein